MKSMVSELHLPSTAPDETRSSSGVSFGTSLRNLRSKAGISQQELADVLNVSRNSVNNWENDKTSPDVRSIIRICMELHITPNELFDFTSEYRSLTEARHLLRTFRSLSPVSRQASIRMLDALLEEEHHALESLYRERYGLFLEEHGVAAAGTGFGYTQEPPAVEILRKNSRNRKASSIIRVKGGSMEPVYFEGDELYYRPASEAFPGQDVVCMHGYEGLIVKRYIGKGRVETLNPAYPFQAGAGSEVTILGVVTGIVDEDDRPSPEEMRTLQELFHDEICQLQKQHGLWE